MIEFDIRENDSNIRADRFLLKATEAPSSMIYKAFRKKDVKINGKWIKEDHILKCGDILRIFIDEGFRKQRTAQTTLVTVPVVYEDNNIVIFNKPAPMPCQPDISRKTSLSDVLKSYLQRKGEYDIAENSFSPALCNRIDTNTTGLVIGAKNAAALRTMNGLIREGLVHKYYLCTVEGKVDGGKSVNTFIKKDEKTNKSTISKSGKAVSMEYCVVAQNGNTTDIEVLLHTGRSHQIRAYFSSIGHPLAGDKKYGAKTSGGQALKSYKIVFSFNGRGELLNYLDGKEITI